MKIIEENLKLEKESYYIIEYKSTQHFILLFLTKFSK